MAVLSFLWGLGVLALLVVISVSINRNTHLFESISDSIKGQR